MKKISSIIIFCLHFILVTYLQCFHSYLMGNFIQMYIIQLFILLVLSIFLIKLKLFKKINYVFLIILGHIISFIIFYWNTIINLPEWFFKSVLIGLDFWSTPLILGGFIIFPIVYFLTFKLIHFIDNRFKK